MIVYKFWSKDDRGRFRTTRRTWEGWFLFGVAPLYIRLLKIEQF